LARGHCPIETNDLPSVVIGRFIVEVKTPAQNVVDVRPVARIVVSGLA
jgi:hypothetical protein